MKKKLVIFGGGVSGISAAYFGLKNNFDVTLIESSSQLGGRINSSIDKETGDSLDNGQHILVGAYNVFLNIIREIGTYKDLFIQDKFSVNYNSNKNSFTLEEKFFSGNLGLLIGLLDINIFSLSDKFRIINLIIKIKLGQFKNNHKPLLTILQKYKQSQIAIKVLWEPMCISMLNTSVDIAATSVFSNVLSQSFFAGGFSSKIIIPQIGLSDLTIPFQNYYLENGGKLLLNTTVKEIDFIEKKINRIQLTKNKEIEGDFYISALNYNKINSLLPLNLNLKSSSIISVYLWYDRNFFKGKFSTVLGTNIQWIFNKRELGFVAGIKEYPEYLSIVISDADKLINLPNKEVLELINKEINLLFPGDKVLLHHKIIKEKNATFWVDEESIKTRANLHNQYSNLFFAGDWTDITLPSTIETAARSGKKAVEKILKLI
jgi:squalene-associated FAD-dependent desaturase